jgi:hypothetical protein
VNEAFSNVISKRREARRDLFVTTATRMGTAVQYVEKDFWVCCLLRSDAGRRATTNRELGIDCARHARMFFDIRDVGLAHAQPGSFAPAPSQGMRDPLQPDYQAIAPMILGATPPFDDVMTAIANLEKQLNTRSKEQKRETAVTRE